MWILQFTMVKKINTPREKVNWWALNERNRSDNGHMGESPYGLNQKLYFMQVLIIFSVGVMYSLTLFSVVLFSEMRKRNQVNWWGLNIRNRLAWRS